MGHLARKKKFGLLTARYPEAPVLRRSEKLRLYRVKLARGENRRKILLEAIIENFNV